MPTAIREFIPVSVSLKIKIDGGLEWNPEASRSYYPENSGLLRTAQKSTRFSAVPFFRVLYSFAPCS
jgi:hypothetical protein